MDGWMDGSNEIKKHTHSYTNTPISFYTTLYFFLLPLFPFGRNFFPFIARSLFKIPSWTFYFSHIHFECASVVSLFFLPSSLFVQNVHIFLLLSLLPLPLLYYKYSIAFSLVLHVTYISLEYYCCCCGCRCYCCWLVYQTFVIFYYCSYIYLYLYTPNTSESEMRAPI